MDQIEEILSKIDIVELINSYVPLKKTGRNFKALCPFHSEKTPSFVVSSELQIFKCFGCGVGGNALKFLTEYERMTFAEALRFLAAKAGVKLKSYQPSKEQQEKDKFLAINHLASEYYHYLLTNHKVGQEARKYLAKRGINSSSIQLFKLGYSPESWDSLYKYLVMKKKYQANDLMRTGLIAKGRGFYDRFRGRIIFPLRNHRNEVVGFSGRVLTPDLKGAKYVNSPETVIYHKGSLLYGLEVTQKPIKTKNQATIVEGEFDLISSYQAGVKNVVAVKGSALTENQIDLLKRFCENIVLCMDSDSAGDAATRRAVEIADKAGVNIRVLEIKGGKDPDEMAQKSAKDWRDKVKKTIPIFDFYISSAKKRFDKNTPEGQRKISEELIPILSKITNEVIKAHYIKKLASLLDVSEEVIVKEMARLFKKSSGVKISDKKEVEKQTKNKIELLEEMLLSLVLQRLKGDKKIFEKIETKYLSISIIKNIFKRLIDFCSKTEFDIRKFSLTLPAELKETVDRLYLYDWLGLLENDREFERQFALVQKEIKKSFLKNKIGRLVKKIKLAKSKEKRENYKKKISELTKRLKDL